MEYYEGELTEPVSPMGQFFDSTSFCLYILAVLEFEVPIHDLPIVSLVKDAFLSLPRFTSILVHDEKGEKRWKSVNVKLEEHLVEPNFIDGMSIDSNDKHFSDYLTKISMENMPKTKPLWQIHVIKYPTSKAAGTLVFKFHHAIGDGYTLMGLLLSFLQRADNPSLPLSFPSLKSSSKTEISNKNFLKRIPEFLSMTFNSLSEFGSSLLKSTLDEDDITPIRSGVETLEIQPTIVSNITFSIDHIKEIKSNLGVTINDVIIGIIFYGIRLYMQDIDKKSRTLSSTALVIANMRNVGDYHKVQDMLKTKKGAWGNICIYLPLSIPKLEDTTISDPLQFVKKAHTSIKKKRNSFSGLLTSKLLLIKNKFQGPEAVGEHIGKTMRNSSMLVSNMIGPLSKMALANHPIKGLFFTVSGVPQIFVITIMSYMGMLRVTTTTEVGFIDEQKLVWYMNNAFEIIHQEAAKENK